MTFESVAVTQELTKKRDLAIVIVVLVDTLPE
jgi:hypothetical protein